MKNWWNELSVAEQQEYLDAHPKSDLQPTPHVFPPEALAQIQPHLGTDKVAEELTPTVQAADTAMDDLPPEEKAGIGARIKSAWTSKSAKARRRAIGQFAMKAGIILLTSAFLTGVTGIPTSFYVPAMIQFNWDDLPDMGTPAEAFDAFKKLFFSSLTAGLANRALLGRGATPAENTPSHSREQAHAIKSNHESDLNKTLTKLESAAGAELAAASPFVERTRVIDRVLFLEQNIPVLGNILVAATPQRLSLGQRANRLLGAYTTELAACYARCTELASGAVDRSLLTVLKQHCKVVPTASTVLATNSNYVAHEYSCFEMRNGDAHLLVLARRTPTTVEIAYSINSMFLPKRFYTVRARDLKAWLKNNIEV